MAKLDLTKYDPVKVKMAQLLADKDSNGMTDAAIAEELGISVRTLYRYKTEEDSVELLEYYADLTQKTFLPEVYTALRKSVRSGSTRALELALKQQGKLVDRKEIAGTMDMSVKNALSEGDLLAEIEELKRRIGGGGSVIDVMPHLLTGAVGPLEDDARASCAGGPFDGAGARLVDDGAKPRARDVNSDG